MPTRESVTETSFSVAADPLQANLPATVNAGDLLLVLVSTFFANVNSATDSTGDAWTQLYNRQASNQSSACFVKVADGDEDSGTINIDLDGAEEGSAQVYRVSGWFGSLAGVEVANAADAGSNSTPDPPSLSPSWGSAATSWIAAAHTFDDDVATNSYPTNYTNGVDTECGAGVNASGRISSAWRDNETATEDPGTFSLASNENWYTATIAIRPAAGGGTTHGPLAGEGGLAGPGGLAGTVGILAREMVRRGKLWVVPEQIIPAPIG